MYLDSPLTRVATICPSLLFGCSFCNLLSKSSLMRQFLKTFTPEGMLVLILTTPHPCPAVCIENQRMSFQLLTKLPILGSSSSQKKTSCSLLRRNAFFFMVTSIIQSVCQVREDKRTCRSQMAAY